MSEFNEDVIEQLAAVRETGACNMLDRGCVRSTANELGFAELSEFIRTQSSSDYMAHLQEMGDRT